MSKFPLGKAIYKTPIRNALPLFLRRDPQAQGVAASTLLVLLVNSFPLFRRYNGYVQMHIVLSQCKSHLYSPRQNHTKYFQHVWMRLAWTISCCVLLCEQANVDNILIWFSGYCLEFISERGITNQYYFPLNAVSYYTGQFRYYFALASDSCRQQYLPYFAQFK